MHITRINHIAVTTTDLEHAKWFYGDVLGLAIRDEGDEASPALERLVGLPDVKLRWAEYHVGGGQILELLQYLSPEGVRIDQRPCDPGSGHFAFEVEDIDETYARLVGAGVEVRSTPVLLEEQGSWDGCLCIYATDPDGFTVEFVQPPASTADGRPDTG